MTTICGLHESAVTEYMKPVRQQDSNSSEIATSFSRAVWGTLAEAGDRVAGLLVSAVGAHDSIELLIQRLTAHEIARIVQSRIEIQQEFPDLVEDIAEGVQRWIPRLSSRDALNAVVHAAHLGAFLLTPEDEDWPRGLDDLAAHAPLGLWARGNRDAVSKFTRSLGVVGARASTGYGEHVTMETVAAIAQQDIAIVSGAAYGIDGMAHRSALAVGGTTMAFLAGGVDRFYPSGHDALLGRIMESGLVLAESPCGYSPTKWRFLLRNRLIAASTQATVVMEAGWRSGSLNTANHAASLGRPLGVVPGPITSASSAGCHRLLREYDAICVTTAAEMCELLPGHTPPADEHEDVE
ncbi:hypothetical protein AINA4_10010 [Aurantimicrobium sp. INA4]|uniref:DNA-processing protein DprA n=1 Tax=Aurantimicrobium sp. INA4 TaxID=2986279 RepID=UPI00248FD6D8|nr:DNA-processing protein DprA [Aurantimicrobium sp. INA4]BDU11080.1 hypothetical protein AINA4_10010 [Aurantimicrobium sp. INA4]